MVRYKTTLGQYNREYRQLSLTQMSNTDVQSGATGFITEGRNEQVALILKHTDRSLCAVKVKRINFQVTTNGYDIDEPEPGTKAINKIDKNSDTCCLGLNVIVLQMTPRSTNIYS